MNVISIPVNKIIDKKFNIKEHCNYKIEKTKRSFEKYGQLYPILVYLDGENYQLVKGSTVFKLIKDSNNSHICAVNIGFKNEIETINLCNLLDESVRDLDILKYAEIIAKINLPDEKIAQELSINLKQVLVLKDLLQIEFNFKLKRNETQQAINFEG